MMTTTDRRKVSEGVGVGFNPKCNIFADPQEAPSPMPSAAEVAEKMMRKRAAQRADEAAYKRAKEASKGALKSDPQRWLSGEDLK